MNILGFIPARGGSKGIPQKNIRPLAGKPLIAYSIESAVESKVDKVFVSTDSREIAEVAVDYGAEVPFLRPGYLARDESVIEGALADTLNRLRSLEGYEPDIIVLLQPTSPLRKARHIDESVELLLKESADTVVSVSEPMEHPGEMVFWDDEGVFHFFLETIGVTEKTQRQEFPKNHFLNGALYTFSMQIFEATCSRFGGKVIPLVMRQIDSIDIDTIDDFLIAEAIIRHFGQTSGDGQ